jgi:hypothetical protein
MRAMAALKRFGPHTGKWHGIWSDVATSLFCGLIHKWLDADEERYNRFWPIIG